MKKMCRNPTFNRALAAHLLPKKHSSPGEVATLQPQLPLQLQWHLGSSLSAALPFAPAPLAVRPLTCGLLAGCVVALGVFFNAAQ
jgi:hypothetical protein